MTDYACVLEPAADGTWSAYAFPIFPASLRPAAIQGEARSRIREAISLHLEELDRHGETVMPPRSQAVVIEV